MSYSRREVQDHVTVMNKDLYDNLQDGIDENKKAVSDLEVSTDGKISEVNEKADTALSISKGKNRARVFLNTKAMQEWLSDETNKTTCIVGDNLYIVDVGVPDWWVSKVLLQADPETGYYYEIAQLETQKVDLTTIEEAISGLQENVKSLEQEVGVVLSATLVAGETSVTFVDSAIKEGVRLVPFTSIFGVNPKSAVVEDGSLIYTFDEQTEDMQVSVEVR